jgi:hypothetical protein
MADVTLKEQQDTSSKAILEQAQEQLAGKVDAASTVNPASASTTDSSQLAQVLALLGSLDITDDKSYAKSIIDFPLEGSNVTERGFTSRIESILKNPDAASDVLKEVGEKLLANPSPELAKFVKHGKLCVPTVLKHATEVLQNVSKEFTKLNTEATNQPVNSSAAMCSSAPTNTAIQADINTQTETEQFGFSFDTNDSYVFMTQVLATMSGKINEIEGKVSENSAKTSEWNYEMSKAFIAAANDALNKAIQDKADYDKKVAKQKKLNSWLKPLMIAVMAVSAVLLVAAGQPWLALIILGVMTMQLSGGTDKLLNAISESLVKNGMKPADAKMTADIIYAVIILAVSCGAGFAADGAAAMVLGDGATMLANMAFGVDSFGSLFALGGAESVMVGTATVASTPIFDDLASVILEHNKSAHLNEDELRLALMITGLVFCLALNIGAGFAFGASEAGASMAESIQNRMGACGSKILMAGAAADIAGALATSVIQILLGKNKMEMSDIEAKTSIVSALNDYFNRLALQTTETSDHIVESNNSSISALGENLSTALNAYAAAGEALAQRMA